MPERVDVAFGVLNAKKRRTMPRKPGQNSEFVMFDVVYEDGTRRRTGRFRAR